MCLVFENEPSENNPNLKDPRTEPFELSQIVYELWNGIELSEGEVTYIMHGVMEKGTAFQDETKKGISSVVYSQTPPLFVQLRKYNVPKNKYKDVGKWEGYSTIEKAKNDIKQFIADNPITKDVAYTYMIMSKYAVDWKTGEDKYNMLYLIGQCTQQIGRIIGIRANEYLPNYKRTNESKNMKKNVVKLNENTLKQIVAESVKKVLKEGYNQETVNEAIQALLSIQRVVDKACTQVGFNPQEGNREISKLIIQISQLIHRLEMTVHEDYYQEKWDRETHEQD